jgi:Outer membrane protein beta-barrel domain
MTLNNCLPNYNHIMKHAAPYLFFLLLHHIVAAQSDLRITSGYAISSLIKKTDPVYGTPPNIDWRSQYVIGAQYRYNLQRGHLNVGLEYCRRGDKNQITGQLPGQTAVRELGYVMLPVTVGYTVVPRISLSAGGYYARLLGYANRFYTDQDIELRRHSIFRVDTKPMHNDLGFIVGMQLQALRRWDLSLEYTRGVKPIKMALNMVYNQAIQLKLGYNLLFDTSTYKKRMTSTRPERFGVTAGYVLSSIEPLESRFFGNLGRIWYRGYSAGFFYRRHFDQTYLNIEALFTQKGLYTSLNTFDLFYSLHQIEHLDLPITLGQELPFHLSVFGGLYVGLTQWQNYDDFLKPNGQKNSCLSSGTITYFQDFGLLGGLRYQPTPRLGVALRYCAGLGKTFFILATSAKARRRSDEHYLRWIQLSAEYSIVKPR